MRTSAPRCHIGAKKSVNLPGTWQTLEEDGLRLPPFCRAGPQQPLLGCTQLQVWNWRETTGSSIKSSPMPCSALMVLGARYLSWPFSYRLPVCTATEMQMYKLWPQDLTAPSRLGRSGTTIQLLCHHGWISSPPTQSVACKLCTRISWEVFTVFKWSTRCLFYLFLNLLWEWSGEIFLLCLYQPNQVLIFLWQTVEGLFWLHIQHPHQIWFFFLPHLLTAWIPHF